MQILKFQDQIHDLINSKSAAHAFSPLSYQFKEMLMNRKKIKEREIRMIERRVEREGDREKGEERGGEKGRERGRKEA